MFFLKKVNPCETDGKKVREISLRNVVSDVKIWWNKSKGNQSDKDGFASLLTEATLKGDSEWQ